MPGYHKVGTVGIVMLPECITKFTCLLTEVKEASLLVIQGGFGNTLWLDLKARGKGFSMAEYQLHLRNAMGFLVLNHFLLECYSQSALNVLFESEPREQSYVCIQEGLSPCIAFFF